VTGAQPWASENSYLLNLSSAELWEIAFADSPAEAELLRESWTQQKSRYDALDQELNRLQGIAADRLGGLAHDEVQQVITLRRAQLRQLLDQASDNATVWASAATALREAQASMRRLPPQSEAARIVYDLAEEYTNLGLRLLGPAAPTGVSTAPAGARLAGAAGVPVAAAAVSAAARRATSVRVPVEPGTRPVQYPPQEPATVQLERAAPVAQPGPAILPAPPLAPLPAVRAAPVWEEKAPASTCPRPPAVRGTRLIAEVADLIVESVPARVREEQLGMPAVFSVRAKNGRESVDVARALHRELSHRLASRAVRGVHAATVTLEVGSLAGIADFWRVLGQELGAAVGAGRPWLRHRIRRALSHGGMLQRAEQLRGATRQLRAGGWLPVVFVEGLGAVSPDLADRLAGAMLSLASDGAATAIFVVAVDSPLSVIARSVVAAPPYPGALVRLVSHGFDVPPPTLDDFHQHLPEFAAAPAPDAAMPAPDWQEHEAVLWGPARAALVAEGSLASAATVLWLWRLYLRVLETGPLSGEEAVAHSRSVLQLARITVRWAEARLHVPGLAGVSLERATEPADEQSARSATSGTDDLRHPAVVALREAASVDPAARSLAAQLT
jgi:hypothetical protein